jgi:hypothetical protein
MELTKECLEEIALAARDVDGGKLVVTIQARKEDEKAFDLKCEYEKRFRVSRTGKDAIPRETQEKDYPQDKY